MHIELDNKNIYNSVFFEIVGFCNAKCPWCMTGNKSLKEVGYPSKFIKVQEFEHAIMRLLDNNLIRPGQSVIYLYDWGEPMLHPELNKILSILSTNNLHFSISTNASKIVHLDNDTLGHLYELRFSVPGFSQSSYDRIHGFNFGQILENIETLIQNTSKGGANVKLTMAYHLYQFNIGEIVPALRFCKANGINFSPYVAFLADFNLIKSYIDKSISRESLEKISKDLFLYYIDELIAKTPKNYECPQFEILTIDEYCDVLTCCLLPKGHPEYSLGNLFTLSYNDIRKSKLSQRICIDCIESGIAFWVHNALVPNYICDFKELMIKEDELQKQDNIIHALSNSKSYRVGHILTWPFEYIADLFK